MGYKNSLNMILGAFPVDVIGDLTNCHNPKQRNVFKRKLQRLFEMLFPDRSEALIDNGYLLIMSGEMEEGINMILKGLGEHYVKTDILKRTLVTLLRKGGLLQEAEEFDRIGSR